jgi:hypothetical protein
LLLLINLGLPLKVTALLELAFDAGSPYIKNACLFKTIALLLFIGGNFENN